jgi:cob(I)alamin adenosyltransferase
MPIYTKKGDKGETGLPGKRHKSKTDPIFWFLGTLDETNASLGLAISLMSEKKDQSLIKILQNIQRKFLAIGACVAAEFPAKAKVLSQLPTETQKLEHQIDSWDKVLPKLENFILSGGAPAGAALHITRTITRKVERRFHELDPTPELEPISIYLNRLSDFFFQGARFYNFRQKKSEPVWKLQQDKAS